MAEDEQSNPVAQADRVAKSFAHVSGDILRIGALRPGAVAIQKPVREPDLARAIQRALGATAAV